MARCRGEKSRSKLVYYAPPILEKAAHLSEPPQHMAPTLAHWGRQQERPALRASLAVPKRRCRNPCAFARRAAPTRKNDSRFAIWYVVAEARQRGSAVRVALALFSPIPLGYPLTCRLRSTNTGHPEQQLGSS